MIKGRSKDRRIASRFHAPGLPLSTKETVAEDLHSSQRVVSLEEIHATLYEHNQLRIEKGAIKPNLIRYAETSMKTGLGLKYIYDYLAVPFLQLQACIIAVFYSSTRMLTCSIFSIRLKRLKSSWS